MTRKQVELFLAYAERRHLRTLWFLMFLTLIVAVFATVCLFRTPEAGVVGLGGLLAAARKWGPKVWELVK
jgi:hypothetical protein